MMKKGIPILLTLVLVAAARMGSVRGAESPLDVQKRRTPIVEAYERARDSVVNISTSQKVQMRRWGVGAFGLPDIYSMPTERQSVGSGVVIHEDGYIATNAHVVSAADQLSVSFVDGNPLEARVIARDSGSDLAVIKVNAGKPLKPVAWGRSDDLMIGEQTIAIGNPVGLQNTVTTGIISALHRELSVEGRVVYHDVIQTDASINPGNSGGALLNILGELVGINTAIRTDAQNIGFAIPVNRLRELLPDILSAEKHNKVQVGMKVSDSRPARVTVLREGSPAARAGVKLGDEVEAVDGRRVVGPVDFYVALLDREPGDEVTLKLNRSGKSATAKMTLTPVPRPDGKQLALRHLGLKIVDVNDTAARQFRWNKQGVMIVAVEPESPASREDIQPGDLLVSMGNTWVTDVDLVGALLAEVVPGTVVDIGIRRRIRGGLWDVEARLYAR